MDTDRNNAQAMDIDLVNETFYACQFCEQAFAVHEECYGGHDLSAKVANEGIALMKDDFVIEEYRPAYLDEEEEKEIEVWWVHYDLCLPLAPYRLSIPLCG